LSSLPGRFLGKLSEKWKINKKNDEWRKRPQSTAKRETKKIKANLTPDLLSLVRRGGIRGRGKAK
jgi:hypothetical protein